MAFKIVGKTLFFVDQIAWPDDLLEGEKKILDKLKKKWKELERNRIRDVDMAEIMKVFPLPKKCKQSKKNASSQSPEK